MFKVELYVDGTRLDLFKDENISITDTIQEIKDPGTIFTAFSQTFTVPSSKTNNKVFKHYYNSRVSVGTGVGFDARYSVDAIIKINGADYKTGTLKLNSVALKKNKAYSYTVNFVGDGAFLRDAILEDDLSVLPLTDYNHDYILGEVKDGMEEGLGLTAGGVMDKYDDGATVSTRSIIYPFISHTKRYVYNSTSTYKTYNPAVTAGTEGVEHTQLKPSLKCSHIIEAIESLYLDGSTFTTDFFGDTEFLDLYLWMNRTKGFIEGVTDNTSWFYMPDIGFTSGTDTLTQVSSVYQAYTYAIGFVDIDFVLDFNVTPTGGGLYDIVIYNENNSVVLFQQTGQTGAQTFQVTISTSVATYTKPSVRIISAGSITALDVTIDAEKTVVGGAAPGTTSGLYTWPQVVPNTEINIPSVIPKMKVMDFLKGIFKMFNLTHYKKADGNIYVDTLDNFYALGTEIDITSMIDVSGHTSDAPVPFDYIGFKYTEPKTFLAKNRFEILNDVFGDEEYSLGTLFGGSKYEIKPGFSHILMERLLDLNDSSNSRILNGWAVDEDENAIADAPLLLYHRGDDDISDESDVIEFSDGTTISTYQSMGNTNSLTTGGDTLNFGAEIDEYVLDVNENSLYANYYENYVSEVYGSTARLVKYTAYLTPSFILNYNMYDKLIVNGVKHKINSITIDLLDGKADLELITEA